MGAGFAQDDRGWITERFATLDARLAGFHAGSTALEVSVKDREVRGQKVTLECWIGGRQKIVTTSAEEDLRAALNDVRDDLRRRLNDAKTRQEPRHNRHLREHAEPDLTEPQP
jgi:ribosome-associated translation inhibitor RaiA